MALPTPTKTYLVSANNYIASNGPLPSQWEARHVDIARVLCTFTTKLIGLGVGISHVASSLPASRSLVAGTNLWNTDNAGNTTNITNFGNYLYNATGASGTAPFSWNVYGSFSPWIVLSVPGGGQLCIGFASGNNASTGWPPNTTMGVWKISYSPGGLFNLAGTPNGGLPAASDELLLSYQAFFPYYSGNDASFNIDNEGIINKNQNQGNYNLQIQVVAANDGSGFWMGAFRNNSCALFLYFSLGLDSPISSGNWGTNVIFHLDRAPLFSRIVENNSTQFKAAFTNSSTWDFRAAAFYTRNQWVRWSPLIDNQLGSYAMYSVPFYAFSPGGSPTGPNTGLKGIMRDIWLGQTQASPAVYPASPANAQFVHFGDYILPWSASAPAPLFIG
jgi:hypothetical protein